MIYIILLNSYIEGSKKINLTSEGFMYTVVKPEKFKEIINEKVCTLPLSGKVA